MSELLSIFNFAFVILLYVFLFFVLIVVSRQLKPTDMENLEKNNFESKYYFKFTSPKEKAGKAVKITEEITIGRAIGCTITLDNDNYASSIHARVSADFLTKTPTIIIEDLGSTNGTVVNSKQIKNPTKLKLGDVVKIGDNSLKLVKKK